MIRADAWRRPLGRRRLLRAGWQIGAGLAAGLAFPAVRACDFLTSNLRIDHVWSRATDDDGFAIVCMTFDDVQFDDRLIGAETPVATSAEIGGPGARPEVDFFIPRNATTVLDEAGPHLRLTGLRQPLLVGSSYPLRLTFEKGGTVPADIDVDYPSLRTLRRPQR